MFSAFGTTTIITSEADPRDPAFFPEATTADIIIGLHYDVVGVQQRRAIEAVKVRGANPLPGLHAITLSHAGLMIYPRLEARVATPLEGPTESTEPAEPQPAANAAAEVEEAEEGPALAPVSTGDLSFGIPALDQLVGGGLTPGTSTLVMGSLGTGKTLLSLHYALAGAQNGEPALFLSFRETREELLRKASAFALGDALRAALAPGGPLVMQRWAPVELHPDVVVDRLLAVVDRTGARRLVVDSIAELEGAIQRRDTTGRINDFLAALLEALRQRGITALFVREHPTAVGPTLDLATGPLSVLAQNVLLLQQITAQGRLHRVVSVVKMRFSAHDTQLHEFTINAPAGIQLLGPFRPQERGRAPSGA
jgi:circadian clock protein KaiC